MRAAMARLDELPDEIILLVAHALDDGTNAHLRCLGLVARRFVMASRVVMLAEVNAVSERGIASLVRFLADRPNLADCVTTVRSDWRASEGRRRYRSTVAYGAQMDALFGLARNVRSLWISGAGKFDGAILKAVLKHGHALQALCVILASTWASSLAFGTCWRKSGHRYDRSVFHLLNSLQRLARRPSICRRCSG